MELQQASNLSTQDFIRMFEYEAKTELELVLFNRLVEYLNSEYDEEVREQAFMNAFASLEDVAQDVVNTLDNLIHNHDDDISVDVMDIIIKSQDSLETSIDEGRNDINEAERG